MFKIQNVCGGSLSIMLEKNCIILPSGAYYDLDGVCSREWIHTDTTLQRLIKNKTVRVTHDSEAHVPKMAISTNEKIFNLLKREERVSTDLPNNVYTPKAPTERVPLTLPLELPHDRQHLNKCSLQGKQDFKKLATSFPHMPKNEPIIVDLSQFVAPAKDPIKEPVIEELPMVKVNEEDLKELFKEFPDLKPKKRGRKKRVKVEEDGSNQ